MFSSTADQLLANACCANVATPAECLDYLSHNKTDLEGSEKSQLLSLGIAFRLLQRHNGFQALAGRKPVAIDISDDDEDDDEDGAEESEDDRQTPPSVYDSQFAEVKRQVTGRLSRHLLALHLNPIAERSPVVPVGTYVAFDVYCYVAGLDAACAGLRDSRAAWLHSQLAGIDSSQGVKHDSPDSLVELIDRVSVQCDVDLAVVVQVAGRRRWRQFAELYRTAAKDAAARIKQQCANRLQASPNLAHAELSGWLLACLRAEQLHSRESFLHQAGHCVSVRPKSGSLLKASARPPSAVSEPSADWQLAKLFGDAIALSFDEGRSAYYDKVPVAIERVLPLFRQADAERWPRTLSKGCWAMWDVVGTFVQLFYVESAVQQPLALLEAVVDVMLKAFVNRRLREFAVCLSKDFARHEDAAYLVISDLTFLDRQLNSAKTAVSFSNASTNTNTSHVQRLVNQVRDVLRSQLDSMHTRIIALNARLQLEALLHDWRPMPLPDGSDGPPAALVAWVLQLALWNFRLIRILSPQSVSHIFLSVALASFERITARLVNTKSRHCSRDITLTLRLALELLIVGVKDPELIGSSFSTGISKFGGNSVGSIPNELVDLCSSYNSLGNTLMQRLTDDRQDAASPTGWMAQSTGRMAPKELLQYFSLVLLASHRHSRHLLAIRLLWSPSLVDALLDLVAAKSAKLVDDTFALLFSCFRAMSSSAVESNLFARFLYSTLQRSSASLLSVACRLLADEVTSASKCLQVAFHRCRLFTEAATRLQSLPCGCPAVGGLTALDTSMAIFLHSLPAVVAALPLSLRLAIGAFDCSTAGLGVEKLFSVVLADLAKSVAPSQAAFDESLLQVADVMVSAGGPNDWQALVQESVGHIRTLTSDGFVRMAKVNPGERDDAFYRQSDIGEAAARELFAAVCSSSHDLHALVRVEDVLSDNVEGLVAALVPGARRDGTLLPIARRIADGDPLSLTNCILQVAQSELVPEEV